MNSAGFIWTKQQCEDAYDDLMIKIAMSSYAEIDGQESLEENERLKNLPQYQLTPQTQKRMRQTIRREALRNSVYRIGNVLYASANKVALVFLTATVIFSTTMFVSASVRSAIYKLIFTYEKKYTLVELDSRTALEFVDSEIYTWDHAYAPTMLPSGYTVSDVVETLITAQVAYTNNTDGYIYFVQNLSSADSNIQVDTEDAESAQRVFINDSEGLLISKSEVNTLIWRIGNALLSLESNEDSETLIAIAKGIKLLK